MWIGRFSGWQALKSSKQEPWASVCGRKPIRNRPWAVSFEAFLEQHPRVHVDALHGHHRRGRLGRDAGALAEDLHLGGGMYGGLRDHHAA